MFFIACTHSNSFIHSWVDFKIFAYCICINIDSVNASGPMCTHWCFLKDKLWELFFSYYLGAQRSNSSSKAWFGNKCLSSLSHLASQWAVCFETVFYYVTHRYLPASTSQPLWILKSLELRYVILCPVGFCFCEGLSLYCLCWSWTLRHKQ